MSPLAGDLPLTGERTVPGVWHENYWFRRHEAAYVHIADRLVAASAIPPAGVLLEAGCGEGYGAALLRERVGGVVVGLNVIGMDYDPPTVAHAMRTYGLPALRANLVALPVRAASADAIVSAQVLEHLWEQDRFVTECARALRPGGVLVVTTPNRRTFPPGNLFHHREVDAVELRALLTPRFDDVHLVGLRHARELDAWESAHGSLVHAQLAAEPAEWPAELTAAVAAVDVRDFVVDDRDVETSLDLLAFARAPR